MSVIRVIYTSAPNFPATDQHPNAVRFQVGAYWVDAIGGIPSQAEVDAVLAIEAAPLIRATTFAALPDRIDIIARLQTATPAQIDTWLTNNVTNLAQARAVLAAIIKVMAANPPG